MFCDEKCIHMWSNIGNKFNGNYEKVKNSDWIRKYWRWEGNKMNFITNCEDE